MFICESNALLLTKSTGVLEVTYCFCTCSYAPAASGYRVYHKKTVEQFWYVFNHRRDKWP